MPVLGSARARRRAVWVAAFAAVVVATAAAIVLLPKGTPDKETLRPGAQVVSTPRTVKLTADRRRVIDDVLDRFIPAAVERRNPLRALPLVTHDFRAGVSRDEWSQGNLPVFPYTTRGEKFHGWRLNYSYPREVSIELLLHPGPRETLGPLAVTAVFKHVGERWLIDSFVPSASFAPTQKSPKVVASPDFTPFAEGRGKAQLSTRWLLVPATILALIVLVPVGLGIAHLRRSRRAWRAYQPR
jgi:hypothetical protein